MKKLRLLFGSIAVIAMLLVTPSALAQDDATTTEISDDDGEDDDSGEIGLVGLLGLLGLLGLKRRNHDNRIHTNNKL